MMTPRSFLPCFHGLEIASGAYLGIFDEDVLPVHSGLVLLAYVHWLMNEIVLANLSVARAGPLAKSADPPAHSPSEGWMPADGSCEPR